jgi:hypothetical protein
MIILLVFLVSFLVFLFTTIFFPFFPPGKIICSFLRNSRPDYLVAGVSGELLISGIINGLIWGVLIILLYSYWKGPGKEKVNLPVWIPGYTTSHNSKIRSKSVQTNDNSLKFSSKTREIELIDGIGFTYGHRLRKIGITTVDDLFQVGYTKTGRNYLAKKVGVNNSTLIYWIRQAERMSK